MRTSDRYELIAQNTATASANRIHDDEVARRYGFRGGLVPGVDVYAYMTRAPASAWGLDWLGRGWMRARFLTPVYEGQTVAVVVAGTDGADGATGAVATDGAAGATMSVSLEGPDGTVCATGEAGLLTAEEPPPASTWPDTDPRAGELPPASPETLAVGTALAIPAHRFHADQAGPYLAGVREELPLYAGQRVAHPGWLLRDANYVLSGNVQLGPWIHVESHVHHRRVVHDGDDLEARAVVTREWERKGHRFVELDVGLLTGGEVAARVTHTAIYRPRPPDPG